MWNELLPQMVDVKYDDPALMPLYFTSWTAWSTKDPRQTIADWARESRRAACDKIYATLQESSDNRKINRDATLSQEQVDAWKDVMKIQMQHAAVRVATLLQMYVDTHHAHASHPKGGKHLHRHHTNKPHANWFSNFITNLCLALVIVPGVLYATTKVTASNFRYKETIGKML